MSSSPPQSNQFKASLQRIQPKLSVRAPNSIVGSSQLGKSAFNWDVYKNRKTALQYLKRNCTLIDTILETEDGSAFEFVHSQVISAFGDKLNEYINQNGIYVESYKSTIFQGNKYGFVGGIENGQNQSRNSARKTVISSFNAGVRCTNSNSSENVLAVKKQVCWSRWPGRVKLIRLPKVNKYSLNILVECAYTGYIRTDLASGGIWQVLDVADHYEMVEVLRACCAFLVKNLDRSNCIYFYHIGIKHRHPLQRNAWHKIRANFKHILAQNLRRTSLTSESMDLGALSSLSNCSDLLHDQQVVDSAATERIHESFTLSLDKHQRREIWERKNNNLATIKYEHFEPLLMHDKLNIDNEESVWHAIKLWCNYNLPERAQKITNLLPCMRFPRFRTGTEFSARHLWRDPLVLNNKEAQHQLAVLDRNHRDFLTGSAYVASRDGFSLPCAVHPRQLRPRVPHSILLAIGGWQQGQPTTLIESYDVNCNLWFESKRRIMSSLAYHGIEYINGLLYICGGTDGSEILNEVFTFDPIRGDCAQKPSMREARCYVSTASLEGHLYAMGGHNGLQRMKSVERFEFSGGEIWKHVQDMNVARSDASACVYNSLIYIAGGLNDQVIESSVEFYNNQDNTWTFAASMVTPRTSFTLLLLNNSLLAIGGNNGTERLSSVEEYSFVTKLWSHHSNMRHKRSTFSAALVDENKLIVVGGYNGQTPFNQVEMYDQETRAWIMLHKIRFDRSGLKVVVVNDLPNATDYTFLGSNGPGYNSSEDVTPDTLAAVPQTPSLTTRARNRFLRSIGAGSTASVTATAAAAAARMSENPLDNIDNDDDER